MDTRTPRTPTGDRSSGFDDAPALSMVKVPSDPAQVIVKHASFRVQLGAATRPPQSPRIARHMSAGENTARMPAVGATAHPGAPADGRRWAVVWSGKSAPDDSGAHRLLQAVRSTSVPHGSGAPTADAGATQVFPRVDVTGTGGYGPQPGDYEDDLTVQTVETPVVVSQRSYDGHGSHGSDGTRLLPPMRTVGSAYDETAYDETAYDGTAYGDSYGEPAYGDGEFDGRGGLRSGRHGDTSASAATAADVRHAYYPGRRMNLGGVLLPLRVFLGFISVYAGMGKLCDPVYFDGGRRGSMVKWLNTLHPWEAAEPLRQFALEHPVGAGLVIAFAQVIVGVLTVLGLWQRGAAVLGALLSAALLVTVSWKTVPAYDTPDIIYLAAWSPLIIAGAPVYSADGRLAGNAWRRLGPRAELWELRRYVLRRGALVTTVVIGLTLLVGSVLGGAVRDADRVVVPGPGEAPRNELPGSPLPEDSGKRRERSPETSDSPTQGATSSGPSQSASAPSATRGTSTGGGAATATGGTPSQTQGTAGQAPPQQPSPVGQAPATSAGPTSSGGTSSSGGTTGGPDDPGDGSGGSEGSGGPDGSGGGGNSGGQPGLVGGLLG